VNFNNVIANSKLRIAQNAHFKMIDENAKILSKRKDETIYSLNINKFKAEEEELNAEIKKFKPISEYNNKLTFVSLPEEVKLFAQDTILKKKRDRWHELLTKDAYVDEALNVLGDLSPKSVVKTKLPYKNKKGKLVGQL
jgi:carboxyl-terminal processing protease